jgi:ABC-2 type transport system ATP-binding protein
MEEKVIVEIQGIVKTYKDSIEPAVNHLTLNIYEGEIFGLLGPNGAGKTTTISILCDLIKPTSGKAKINGLFIHDAMRQIKGYIGVVSQDIALYEQLTAVENLRYFGGLYGIEKNELKNRINDFLHRLGLDQYKNKKVKTYSGGMKRRLNLIAGILHEPKLIFLDEPTVGIDVQSRNVIIEFLKEANKKGITILYTSHFMEEAEKLCTRICVIDYGKLVIKGTPSELMKQHESESLEEVFLKLTGKRLRD